MFNFLCSMNNNIDRYFTYYTFAYSKVDGY